MVFNVFRASASAGTICRPLDDDSRDEVMCDAIENLLEEIEEFERSENQPRGPKLRVADFAYAFNDMLATHRVGVDDVLVIDVKNQYQPIRRKITPLTLPDSAVRQLATPLPPLAFVPHLPEFPEFPDLPDIVFPDRMPIEFSELDGLGHRKTATMQTYAAEPDPEIHEGVNTDGQMLYGPPGASTFGCSGWPQIDQCKLCCSGSRTAMLPGVYLVAKKCHTAASLCTVWFWACHAGCIVLEASLLGAIYYSFDKCNNGCYEVFWNDTSVDWSGPSRQPLHWDDDVVECEGWLMAGDVPMMNGGEHVSIPGIKLAKRADPTQHGRHEGSCVILEDPNNDVNYEVKYGVPTALIPTTYLRVMGRKRSCPAPEHPTYDRRYIISTEQKNNGIVCLDGIDYRIVDMDPYRDGNQTPWVGYVRVEGDDAAFYFERGDGSRLYLDGLPKDGKGDAYWRKDHFTRAWDWFPKKDWKIWAYGHKSGNRLRVDRYKLLTSVF
jgi:hypothetical protein